MRERLPLILSATALLVAVLGTPIGEAAYNAVAPSNVGTAQLRNNSITAAKLRKGSVTNAKLRGDAVTSGKVKNRSLKAIDFRQGQLPAGPRGPKGQKGDKGDRGPRGAAAALTCPTGTTRFVSVCIENTPRGPKRHSAAGRDCADERRRLPSSAELAAFREQPGVTIGTEWSSDLGDVTYKSSFVYLAFTQTGNGVEEAFKPFAYRCVAGLVNGP
jgi:hypothetical protein